MPEQTSKKLGGLSIGNDKHAERLATHEELAEYGAIAPDPNTEAKILALFEEQLVKDLVQGVATLPGAAEKKNLTTESTQEMTKLDPTNEGTSVPAPTGEIDKKEGKEKNETKETKGAAADAEVLAPEAEGPEETRIESDTEKDEEDETAGSELDEVPESYATASGLVEFAEVLDQHRLWVESGGKESARGDLSGANLAGADLTGANLQGIQLQKAKLTGADLSMASLRNANLVEADLRESNLLGTEFSGANLMGANLFGSEGLWLGRMGGTNLFDAALPEAVAALSGSKTIAQFTQAARWFYLMLMALCAGSLALIAMTTDVRLLLDQAAWRASQIPNILPLQGFYLGAPLLLTMLYLRLQFLLLRLWGSMGALPSVFPDGQTPEKDGCWYLMGPIRPYLRWSRDPRSPLGIVECYVAMLLAYWAVPVVLFFFWLRYLVLQDYRGTLLHVFLFGVSCTAACALPRIVKRVLRPGDWTDETTPQFLHDVLKGLWAPAASAVVLFVLSVGVIRGLPGDPRVRPEVAQGDVRRWASTLFQGVGYRPYADLTDESMAGSQKGASVGEGATNEGTGPRLNEINLRYARGYHAAFANARLWRSNLEGTSLAEADFRGANLREANLKSAQMDRVLAEKANLVSVDAEGAVFSAGGFQGADFSYANLEGATLATGNLTKATMYAVNLRHANLLRAELAHADLRDIKAEEANFSLASLEQTDFSSARMMGVNLTGAQAKRTIFLEADLSRGDLRGANFAGAVLREVKLDGASLMGADFRGALGLEAWQVCSAHGWRGAQFDPDVQAAVERSCGTAESHQP